jgi:predicted O-methyltransferase YrrM
VIRTSPRDLEGGNSNSGSREGAVRAEDSLPIPADKPVSRAATVTPATIEEYMPKLAKVWEVPLSQLQAFYNELQANQAFLADFNRAIRDVPEFAGVRFGHVSEFRLYRCLLYLLTRALRPEVFVETGVLNGFSSAFILLAMEHNAAGTLYSIDLPPADERIRAQGTGPLPHGKVPGWAIPEALRTRHRLSLGDARILLPQILHCQGSTDVFLHDSDHSYEHMMLEMALAWPYLRAGGWLLCDNVEQNQAFFDFVRGVNAGTFVAASFDSLERTWKHGLARKHV